MQVKPAATQQCSVSDHKPTVLVSFHGLLCVCLCICLSGWRGKLQLNGVFQQACGCILSVNMMWNVECSFPPTPRVFVDFINYRTSQRARLIPLVNISTDSSLESYRTLFFLWKRRHTEFIRFIHFVTRIHWWRAETNIKTYSVLWGWCKGKVLLYDLQLLIFYYFFRFCSMLNWTTVRGNIEHFTVACVFNSTSC